MLLRELLRQLENDIILIAIINLLKFIAFYFFLLEKNEVKEIAEEIYKERNLRVKNCLRCFLKTLKYPFYLDVNGKILKKIRGEDKVI